ncbi:2-oxoacid:acceptor oxidoreductase subunit alpha [Candidatus Formimonas warabiya]|uniref:2-oxoglutarate synthase subunit alpha n=1 Tax=Formimonas warabiya TaxID=1761012 RepID=A0A3G1KPP5_FORW1|nr:2-oxoacid:acceptor oxidoreductase subunit alpha [Candidatus Formimonas warabiya]ATW24417.1 2-oxoglutarate synthase subunit alpha [Candidatus Formimonas warabiya]
MAKKRSIQLMQGNEACALGALKAGVRFFAGYPITPSTEIAEVMAKELPKLGGKFIQMEDEIASMAAIIGASLTGKKVLTATSGPGFSLKQENLGYACITEIPCVIVNVQRGGPSTGLPTSPAQGDVMQAKWGTHGDHPVIALCPASIKESYTLAVRAVNLAEKYMMPVILLMDEVVGHLREPLNFSEVADLDVMDRKKPQVAPEEYIPFGAGEDGVPALAPFGTGYRYHVTGLTHDESGFSTMAPKAVERMNLRLVNKVTNHLDEILDWEEENMEEAEIVLLAYGGSARSAKEAMNRLNALGYKVGLFRPISIWPFPEKEIKKIAPKVEAIVVPEMNLGQLKLEVERAAGGQTKVIGVNKVDGELVTPEEIVKAVKEVK